MLLCRARHVVVALAASIVLGVGAMLPLVRLASPAGATTIPGVVSTFASIGYGDFSGLATDPAGNIYTVDSLGCHVLRFDPSGNETTIVNPGSWCYGTYNVMSTAYAVLGNPGVGTLIIGNYNGGDILEVPTTGGIPQPVYQGSISPTGIAYDSATDTLYIADDVSSTPLWTISNFSTTCTTTSVCGNSQLASFAPNQGASFDQATGALVANGNIYTLAYYPQSGGGLLRSAPVSAPSSGPWSWTGGYDSLGNATYGSPGVDPSGNVYYINQAGTFNVVPPGASTASSMSLTGTWNTFVGGPAYANGALYVLDQGSSGYQIDQVVLPPSFTSSDATTFYAGYASTFSVAATGLPAPSVAVTSGSLPPGVTLGSDGTLSGTPAAGSAGTYPITITATNGAALAATQSFTLTVADTPPPSAPTFTNENHTTFVIGQNNNFSATTSGYPASEYSIIAGSLPHGISFNPATGAFSGSPAAGTEGTYVLTLSAQNGVGDPSTQVFTLTIIQESSSDPSLVRALASTGSPIGQLLTLGTGTLVVGTSLQLRMRSRRLRRRR